MIPASSETLTIAIILLFLFGAISFYLYSRITQIEKKMSLLENILLDLKVATESSITSFPFPDQLMTNNTPQFNYTFYGNNEKENMQESIDLDTSNEVVEELGEVGEFVLEQSSRPNRSSLKSESEFVLEQSSKPNRSGLKSESEFVVEQSSKPTELEEVNTLKQTVSIEESFKESTINNIVTESIPDEKQLNINHSSNSYVESVISVNKTTESPYENMTVKELQVIAKAKGISVSGLKRVQIIDILKQNDSNKINSNDATESFNETSTLEENFSSGEGGEVLSMDAPSSLIEASSIDN